MTANPDTLSEHFAIHASHKVIALVGGGGKTSLMFALARDMASRGQRVITTTTTHILRPDPEQSPLMILVDGAPDLEGLSEALDRLGRVTVGQRVDPTTGKVKGVAGELVTILSARADCVLVEADGAARKPVKAPESWEPALPEFSDMIIPVVGLDCLGKPVSSEWVHRVDRFTGLTGLREGDIISAEAVATVIAHIEGGLKGLRDGASAVPFLNKRDAAPASFDERGMAEAIFSKSSRIHRVVVGSLKPEVRVTSFLRSPNPIQ